jgi:regulator of RNase E activity RraA
MSNNKYYEMPEMLSKNIIERAKKLSPAQLADGMKNLGILRNGSMNAEIMPVDENKIMVGTAYTVNTQDGDNLPIHVALYRGKPGYVLIVAGKGYKERAYIGDLMGATGDAMGLAGIVVDGMVRDKLGLRELKTPIYAMGYMQRSPDKQGPGEINTLVECGGVTVEPGDLVVGDCDGVTVVPKDRIDEVLEKAEEKNEYEINRRKTMNEYVKCIAEGKEPPEIAPAWVIEMQNK